MKKEQENKKDYESPLTKQTRVEMEGNLCGSITPKTDEGGVKITEQEVMGSSNDFSDTEWGKIDATTQN